MCYNYIVSNIFKQVMIMADKADRKNYDGSITPGILAESLGEFDRNAEYRCCGRVNGEKCNAPLTLVISKYGNYFREKSSAEPHKKGCIYKNVALTRLISRLDRSGSSLIMDDLFSSIANQHRSSSARSSLNSPVVTGESRPSAKNTQGG